MKITTARSIAILLFASAAAYAAEPHTIRAPLQAPAVRKPAPAFQLLDASGKARRNSSYRGKVLLLDFWATECGGCKQEIPAFIALQNSYRRKGLTAVGVSMDIAYENLKDAAEAWARVKPFVRSQQLNYAILMGDDRVTKAYDIQAMPATYLIDKTGRIAATYVGVVDRNDIEANIKMLLNE
ncbi:MAG TPA: TlpA disulfide reductase family protein [Bryobacteraceae bacterium]|nr:TlpA disulfide reductase family protein [Bryobacteraceae bacterium]